MFCSANQNRPLLTAMVSAENPQDAISIILNSHYDGAEAFYFQIELLKKEFWNEKTLREIFDYCHHKPIIVTAYRYGYAASCTDEERAELLLLGLKSGATVCDIMGDMFCQEKNQLTFDAKAIAKQKELIDTIHARNGQIIISTHLSEFLSLEDIIFYAKTQERRNADMCKIVSIAESEEQLLENLKIASMLKKEIKIPYLFLANGEYSKILRLIGPSLGVCMFLCVQHFGKYDFRDQPQLRAASDARNIFG